MFKKRLLLALAIAGMSFGTLQAVSISGLATSSAESAIDCTGGGSESFTNIPASSSAYSTRTWTGDNDVAWSATDARTDQTLTGKAIALRTSTLKNTTPVAGGIGTLTFNYKRVFTGNSTLKVFVNGVQYGADIAVSSETSSVFSQVINVSGNVTIEIKNSGNRTVIDNIAWNCFDTVTGPELQIADASNVNKDCGEYTLDFGTHSVDVYTDAVFSVKNTGTTVLTVSALNLSNSTDFTVISPSVPFTVPASGSAIVVVRFDAVTGGDKTSTLTIVSNDTNEGRCTVNLAGTGIAPCAAPVADTATLTVNGITSSSADITVSNAVADAYLAVITTGGALSSLPVDGSNYTVGDSIGGGTVAYIGTLADFTLTGLLESTQYSLYIYPYNNVDCSNGPVYNTVNGLTSPFNTPVAPCIGGSESFTNMPASSSAYTARTWTGDNGIIWSATDARTDQTLTARAIALRTGSLTNTTSATGGIGTLTFKYKRVFTGNSTLKVFVNGAQYGGNITVSSDSTAVYSQAINMAGNITVEIQNSGNRTVIDDLSWNCYEAPDSAEIQILDSTLTPQDCGYTYAVGNVEVNSENEATFTIKNDGLQNLEISSITIDDNVNYTIVSPAAPFTVAPLSSEDVLVVFNSATTGNKPAVLTIVSNDADEASCSVNFIAQVLDACDTPLVFSGKVAVSNQATSSVDVAVSGVTADGYIAVISAGGTITAPSNGTVYEENDTIGTATVAYVGTSPSFTIENLDAGTTYTIFVYAYNSSKCIGGPAYSESALETSGTTTALPCTGGSETFANIPASSSAYATRTWTGDNGIVWTATDARTDQTLTGKAIALRAGTLENVAPITGGIGTLTFNYKRVFTGDSTLKVFVNGVQYGTDITVSSDTATLFSQVINVSADATIEIVNSGNRIIVDDLSWNCYSGVTAKQAAPSLNTTGALENEVKLYPNPNKGQFQLDLATETADVAIYNTLGKEVLKKKVSDNEMINLEYAEQGIYMVVITAGNTVTTKKVMIK